MKVALITLLLVILSGCTTLQRMVCEDTAPPEKEVIIDPRYLEECRPLHRLSDDQEITFDSIMNTTAENAIIYAECRSMHNGNIRLIKKFGNIK